MYTLIIACESIDHLISRIIFSAGRSLHTQERLWERELSNIIIRPVGKGHSLCRETLFKIKKVCHPWDGWIPYYLIRIMNLCIYSISYVIIKLGINRTACSTIDPVIVLPYNKYSSSWKIHCDFFEFKFREIFINSNTKKLHSCFYSRNEHLEWIHNSLKGFMNIYIKIITASCHQFTIESLQL